MSEATETKEVKQKPSPARFVKEVQSEVKKVTWPSRKETITSTIFVFIMVFLIAVFLYFADQIIAWLIQLIIGLGIN